MTEEINTQEEFVNEEDEIAREESGNFVRCLTFESSDLILFISTEHVIEIINDHSITELPLVPDYVKGIINLRGQILPIVDIRLLMGSDAIEYTSKTCIIVLNIQDTAIGIVVDTVRQVVDINMDNVHPIPMKSQRKLLNGMINMDDGTVCMSFDCDSLVDSRMM